MAFKRLGKIIGLGEFRFERFAGVELSGGEFFGEAVALDYGVFFEGDIVVDGDAVERVGEDHVFVGAGAIFVGIAQEEL